MEQQCGAARGRPRGDTRLLQVSLLHSMAFNSNVSRDCYIFCCVARSTHSLLEILRVMQILLEEKQKACPNCWGVCARYSCSNAQDVDTRKLCASFSFINTGIAFNRSTYEQIRASTFESFPDGWDWSLFHLVQTGQIGGMMLGPAVSRLENLGKEGATVNSGTFLMSPRYAHVLSASPGG
jgi:hypothetical protein